MYSQSMLHRVRIETENEGTFTAIWKKYDAVDESTAIILAQKEFPKANVTGASVNLNTINDKIDCRIGCGACCVWFKINEPFFGQPNGKASGERCFYLSDENICLIYEERPQACRNLVPRLSYCGTSNEEAWKIQEKMVTNA